MATYAGYQRANGTWSPSTASLVLHGGRFGGGQLLRPATVTVSSWSLAAAVCALLVGAVVTVGLLSAAFGPTRDDDNEEDTFDLAEIHAERNAAWRSKLAASHGHATLTVEQGEWIRRVLRDTSRTGQLTPSKLQLLSTGAKVFALEDGDHGLPSVVTDVHVDNWQADRWQASAVMPQWLVQDLGRFAQIVAVLIDWETAYASAYRIDVSRDGVTWSPVHTELHGSANRSVVGTAEDSKNLHIVHEIRFSHAPIIVARYVRLVALTRGTDYGISIWRFLVFGYSL